MDGRTHTVSKVQTQGSRNSGFWLATNRIDMHVLQDFFALDEIILQPTADDFLSTLNLCFG